MIKYGKGEFQIQGTAPDILSELATIAREVRGTISGSYGEERAQEMVREAFELSLKTDEELHEALLEAVSRMKKNAEHSKEVEKILKNLSER